MTNQNEEAPKYIYIKDAIALIAVGTIGFVATAAAYAKYRIDSNRAEEARLNNEVAWALIAQQLNQINNVLNQKFGETNVTPNDEQ